MDDNIIYEILSAETVLKKIKKEKDYSISKIVADIQKIGKSCPEKELINLITETVFLLKKEISLKAAIDFLYRIETRLNLRKPKLAIYDHAFHFIGGAQKYGLTMIKALEDLFDITIISNKKVTHEDLKKWYDLDLSGMEIKVIPIPYFEKLGTFHIEPHRVTKNIQNPFHIISRESGMYDIFINNGMLELVYPLSPVSILVCHFPERRPQSYFYSDRYTYTIYNSRYTGEWINKRWKYKPHKLIYPPVDMDPGNTIGEKEKIVLSVARFEEGGTKKQFEMVKAFIKLRENYPVESKGWRLLLVGGATKQNRYLESIVKLIENNSRIPVELHVNISGRELRSLYKRAEIFWHLCGIGQNDPAKVEHFGMTIAEAMQNGVIPIVFDGGGQKEIVENEISGFRIKSLEGLIKRTVFLMSNTGKTVDMRKNVFKKSKEYDVSEFNKRVKEFFKQIFEINN